MRHTAAELDDQVVGARTYLATLTGAELDEQAELLGCGCWELGVADDRKRERLLAEVCLRVTAPGDLPYA